MHRLVCLVVVSSLALLAPSPAVAKERAFTARAKSGSEKDKATAIKHVLSKAVDLILKEEGLFDKVQGKPREALIAECESLLTRARFKERRGRWRYSARLDLELVRKKVLAAAKKVTGLKGLKFTATIELIGRKAGSETDTLRALVRTALGKALARSGHVLLEGDPKKAPANALRITIRLGIKFEPSPPKTPMASAYKGRYRLTGTTYQVYDPAADAVRIRGRMRSESSKTELEDSNEQGLAEPNVRKNTPLDVVEGDYAEHVGTWLARLIVKQLRALPAPSVAYQVRLKGFSEEEVLELHEALEAMKSVSEFKEVGKVGAFQVAKMKIAGEGRKVVEAALLEAGLKAKVSTAGNTVIVTK
ncbi:MAG: hypothetical protein JKY65_32970 [Planctomycetes bacterium]|nr:hypothetical protein [Planctomycetota bacterium]